MNRTKLILIEGIPGAGKTTTARFAAGWLGQHGFEPRLHLEGDLDHPADYEATAYLSDLDYADLLERFPAWRGALEALADRSHPGEVFISYRKLTEPPAGLLSALAEQDVYTLSADPFQRVTLRKWQTFAALAAGGPDTYIFECCYLQNQLTTLLAVHDLPASAAAKQIERIAQALRPLNPLIVYLEPVSIRATLERARAERPREWLDFVIQYITGQAWGQTRGLSGFEGMIQFYETRRDLEKVLFPNLFANGLWIEQADRDWPATQARLAEFLAQRLG